MWLSRCLLYSLDSALYSPAKPCLVSGSLSAATTLVADSVILFLVSVLLGLHEGEAHVVTQTFLEYSTQIYTLLTPWWHEQSQACIQSSSHFYYVQLHQLHHFPLLPPSQTKYSQHKQNSSSCECHQQPQHGSKYGQRLMFLLKRRVCVCVTKMLTFHYLYVGYCIHRYTQVTLIWV